MSDLGLPFKFKKNIEKSILCSQNITAVDKNVLLDAVKHDYVTEYFVDDLPIWSPIGVAQDESIYTHRNFTISFNKNRVKMHLI